MKMNQTAKRIRILAVSLSSRGFGYAVMEGNNRLIYYGKKIIEDNKNIRSLAHIDKLIARSQPNVLALQDVNARGTHRADRIKALHRKVVALAKKDKIVMMKVSGTELRDKLLGDEDGTKYEMAEMIAKRFPDELASRLPPKRKAWTSEDTRMDIFDAVGLAVALRLKKSTEISLNKTRAR